MNEICYSDLEQKNNYSAKITYLDVDGISDFPDHPYHVVEDESLMELSESIKK